MLLLAIFLTFLSAIPAGAEVRYQGHSEYELPPECRQNLGKVCNVPASVFRRLTQEQKAFMYGYASDRGIQWRLVNDTSNLRTLRPRHR